MKQIEISMKKVLIAILLLILMIGVFKGIAKFQEANKTISINAIALDRYKDLNNEEFELNAVKVEKDLYEIKLPEKINDKLIANTSKVVLQDNTMLEIKDNKVVLTKEQLNNNELTFEVAYNFEVISADETLYNKIMQYESEKKDSLVELKGYLPENAKLQVKEVSKEQIKEIFGDKKIDVAYDIKIVDKDENGKEVQINPENYGMVCEVVIRDKNIAANSKVYHVKNDNTYELAKVIDNEEKSITFEADSFSIYAVEEEENVVESANATFDDKLTNITTNNGYAQKVEVKIEPSLWSVRYYNVTKYCWTNSITIPSDEQYITFDQPIDGGYHIDRTKYDWNAKVSSDEVMNDFCGLVYLHMYVETEDPAFDTEAKHHRYVGPFYIDNMGPRIELENNTTTGWKNKHSAKVTIKDESGVESLTLKYAWSDNDKEITIEEMQFVDVQFNKGDKECYINVERPATQGKIEQLYLWTHISYAKDMLGNTTGVGDGTSNGMEVSAVPYKFDSEKPSISFGRYSGIISGIDSGIRVYLKDEGAGLETGASVKYGWSTSKTTEPLTYRNANTIVGYEKGANMTYFSASTADLIEGEQYYLWVKAITLRDCLGHSSDGEIATSGSFSCNFAAPTIEVNYDYNEGEWIKGGLAIEIKAEDEDGISTGDANIQFAWGDSNTIPPINTKDIIKGISLGGDQYIDFPISPTESEKLNGKKYLWLFPSIKDKNGNFQNQQIVEGPFYFDNTVPTVEVLQTGEETENYEREKEITVKISDSHSGLLKNTPKVSFSWHKVETEGGTEKPENGTGYSTDGKEYYAVYTSSVAREGKFYLGYTIEGIIDDAGNTLPDIEECVGPFYIDKVKPTITLEKNSDTTLAKTHEVVVTLKDKTTGLASGASVKYGWSTSKTQEPENYTNATLSYSAKDKTTKFKATGSGLSGEHYLWVVPEKLKDVVGNSNKTAVKSTGTFNFDNSGPAITLGENANETWAKTHSVEVTISEEIDTIEPDANVEFGWSTSATTQPTTYETAILTYASDAKSATFTATGSELSGEYYLWVVPKTLKDSLGNSNTTNTVSTGVFKFDNTKPTAGSLTFTNADKTTYTPGENNWTNQDVTITKAQGTDALSGVESTTYKVNGKETTETTLTEGKHTIETTTTDNAGNTSDPVTYKVNIDKTKPTMQISPNGATESKNKEVTITVSDSGESGLNANNSYQYQLGTSKTQVPTGEWTTYTSGTKFVIGTDLTGEYYLWVKTVSDNAGNKSAETQYMISEKFVFNNEEDNQEISSIKYIIDEENFISNILPETNVTELLENIVYENKAEIKIYNKDGVEIESETLVATGMKLKVKDKEYTLVVKGDVTGDGKITLNDAIRILRHRADENQKLQGEYLKAAQAIKQGEISLSHAIIILRYRATGNWE